MPDNGVVPRVLGGRAAVLASGLITGILGVVIAVWPDKTVAVTELLAGSYLLVSGLLQLWIAVAARFAVPLRLLVLVGGVVSLLLAALAARGGNSILLVALWLGIGWAVRGVIHATVAVWDDRLPGAGRHELLGLFTMLLGIALLAIPFDSVEALTLAAGGAMIVLGILELLSAGIAAPAGRPSLSPGAVH
ncbi:DUF308 domain-containing protein [Nocardia sp. NPDC127579]|uniref:DUF308 domain-containing protein n=1 Tax=Nocardia sp. NPDC127579 TaxID=3345402 RepID=UPI00363A48AA